MVRAPVETILGESGRQILYFYEANALSLNLIILTYGLVMLMSWVNLIRVYRYMVVLVAKQIHLHPELNRKSTVKKIGDTVETPWQQAVDAAPFPLIASQIAFIPARKSVEAVRKIIDEHEMLSHALDVLKGADPRRVRPSYKMMWKKEVAKRDAPNSSRRPT